MTGVVLVLCYTVTIQSSIDAGSALKLLKDESRKIEDVSFDYQGQGEFLGPIALLERRQEQPMTFHGYYAYRSDETAYKDMIIDDGIPDTLMTRFAASWSNQTTTTIFTPAGIKKKREPNQVKSSLFEFMREAYAPGDLFGQWEINAWTAARFANVNFRGTIREEEGRQIVRIEYEPLHGVPTARYQPLIVVEYDLSRGGNKILEQTYRNGKLTQQVRHQLVQVRNRDGETFWFPNKAVESEYVFKNVVYDVPVFVTTYNVEVGSIRLNEGASDAMFDVGVDQSSRYSPNMMSSLREFLSVKPPKFDKESIDRSLAERIQTADEKSEALDASRDDRRLPPWGTTGAIVGSGAGLVMLSVWLRRRR